MSFAPSFLYNITFCVPKSGRTVPPPLPTNPASQPPCEKDFAGQPLEHPRRNARSCVNVTKMRLVLMPAELKEVWIIEAIFILVGLFVGAWMVIAEEG